MHAEGRYRDFAFGGWTLEHNVVYGHAPDGDGNDVTLTLDLYQPAGDVAPSRPVLIYAHGGAFKGGNKESGHDGPYAMNFAQRGFVSASIDYRLDGSEQDATDDMQAAVRWFRAHATEYRVDPTRIAVIGSSSGAVMALSTAFAPEDPGNSGTPGVPSDVAAGLSISGTSEHPDTITAGDPPIAMFHAQNDTTIPYAAAQATCQQTQLMGNVCEFFSYATGGHPPPFAINNREDIAAKSSDFMVRREGIDTVPPVTADDVPSAYRSRPVEVALAARDDGGSGPYRTYYATGADPPAPTTASAVYDPAAKPALRDGERIRYFSIDRAGNAEPVRTSRPAHVDGEAPATTDDVPDGYRTRPVAVTLSAADSGGSGLDRTYYTTGSDPPAPSTASAVYDPAAKPALRDGERIGYFSVDGAGNAEPVRTSQPAHVDGDAPATADDVPDGYLKARVTVTLSAADSGSSGLAATHYTTGVDPAAPTAASATYDAAAKPTLGDGEHIRYFSVDRAGNTEPVRTSGPAHVDGDAPATTDDVPEGYRTRPVAVTLTAADSGSSGLAATHYTTGADPPAPTAASRVYDPAAKPTVGDGERIRYLSIDRAGNAEAVRTSRAARVDGEAPATSDDVPDGYRTQPVTVTLTAADSGSSGLAATHYTTGADPPAPTTASATYDAAAKPTLGDGERVRYFSIDRAGNAEALRTSQPAHVDADPPSSETRAPGTTTAPAIAVEYSAADAGAGVERVELFAKGPLDSAYAPAATASAADGSFDYEAREGPGDYAFYTVAYDAAGNAEPTPDGADAVTTLVPRTRAATLDGSDLTAARDGSVAVVLSNPNPFAVSGRVILDSARALVVRRGGPARIRRIGTGAFSIPAGGRATVEVAIRTPVRHVLAQRRRLRVRVRRTTDGVGGAAAAATVARLAAPRAWGY